MPLLQYQELCTQINTSTSSSRSFADNMFQHCQHIWSFAKLSYTKDTLMYLSSHVAGFIAAVKYLLGFNPPPPSFNPNLQNSDPNDPSKDEVLLLPLEGLTLEDPKTPTE